FPRHGSVGLRRAAGLLQRGRNVVLFPEGTRSTTGEIAPFKPGIGVLARAGATVVPVGIAGTRDILAKGRMLPRRAPVVVTFGAPLRLEVRRADGATACIERAVRAGAARASLARPVARRTWYARAHALASGRAGV